MAKADDAKTVLEEVEADVEELWEVVTDKLGAADEWGFKGEILSSLEHPDLNFAHLHKLKAVRPAGTPPDTAAPALPDGTVLAAQPHKESRQEIEGAGPILGANAGGTPAAG